MIGTLGPSGSSPEGLRLSEGEDRDQSYPNRPPGARCYAPHRRNRNLVETRMCGTLDRPVRMIIHLGGAGTERLLSGGTREIGAVPRTSLCGAPLQDAHDHRVLAPHDHPNLCLACRSVLPHSRYTRLVGVLVAV